MRVLFLYLKAFSFTGGIEKFNRSFLKALHELSVDGFFDADGFSSFDTATDERYFPAQRFKGYGGKRMLFVIATLIRSFKYDTIILGHINLSVIGYMIKKIRPNVKLILVTHGIEVWKTHVGHKKKLLECADIILSVSEFTKTKIIEFNPSVAADKIRVFPNTIDPYFVAPTNFEKPDYLVKRYNIDADTKVILTVTRLSFSEKYKGYDNTIELLHELGDKENKVRYLLCGKADKEEENRIQELIKENNIAEKILLTGFIKDEELIDHYLLADVFAMPSKKEGFGIVFIEALTCGRKVIAGSKDGSVDALLNGKLGKLVDPDSKEELIVAIQESLDNVNYSPLLLQQQVFDAFGFHRYKERLKNYLTNNSQQD